jgi:hypothetical protein
MQKKIFNFNFPEINRIGMKIWRKKMYYFALSIIPKVIRHRYYRMAYARLPRNLPENISFELARSQEDLEAAFRLLHDAYVEQGFMAPHYSHMRLTIHHALPTTMILVAKINEVVVGTVSLMCDNPLGMPMEKVFDLSQLKQSGLRGAELSCLAIHPDYRRNCGGGIYFPLNFYAIKYAHEFFGIDYLVWNIYPHHADFVNAIFGSQYLNNENMAPVDYLGAPAIGIQINPKLAYAFYKEKYSNLKDDRNLFDFLFIKKHSFFKFPSQLLNSVTNPVMTPQMLEYFFLNKTRLFQNISEYEKQVILNYYWYSSYQEIFSLINNFAQTKEIAA